MNPFLLPNPSVISFSGGRTSAYMLRRVLDAHNGTLPPHVVPIFCNTGKERQETLDFVERCSQRWNVQVVWLEYSDDAQHKFRVVDYATASRAGEPFDQLIARKQMLPNVMMRFCTQWLKIKVSNRYTRHRLHWKAYVNAIGLRADEPRRIARLHPDPKSCPGEEPFAPLAKAGVTLADITAYWQASPFDLGLRPDEGNCDLCFLKGQGKLLRLMRESPERADWWIEKEQQFVGKTRLKEAGRFRKNAPSYCRSLEIAQAPGLFDAQEEEDFPDCRCTD